MLNEALNPSGAPHFEAAALHGIGVFETLKSISRLALTSVRKKLAADAPRHPGFHVAGLPPGGSLWMAQTHPAAAPAPAIEAPVAPPAVQALAHGDELSLEFAEDDTAKHAVRPVATRGHLDIQKQLEELRAMTAARPVRSARPASSRGVERRLEEILIPDRDSRPEVKRKASVEVPTDLLRGSSAIRLHVAFDGETGEETIEDVVTVKLAGNRRLDRLTLHLDIELKGKA
jgi:hypothetical protein